MRVANRVIAGAIVCVAALVTACGGAGGRSRSCDPGTFEPSYSRSVELARWRAMPVRVYIVGEPVFQGTNLRREIEDGFDDWTQATGGRIRCIKAPSRREADIVVRVQVLDEPDPGRAGVTTTGYSGSRVTAATVTLNVWDGIDYYGLAAQVRTVAAHEFGHALGIDGHSPDSEDVMYATPTPGASLTDQDVNTIRTAYCGLFDEDGQDVEVTRAAPCDPCVGEGATTEGATATRTHVCGLGAGCR